MRKVLIGFMAILTVFAMISCDNGTTSKPTTPATTYTVTFDSNGGSYVAPKTGVASGAKITAPTNPTRLSNDGTKSYTFDGWFRDGGSGTQWNFASDTVTGNITLTAKWTAPEGLEMVTVYFHTNDGRDPTEREVEVGSKITAPTAPVRETHDFGGWYKEEACTNAWDFNTDTVTENTNLYAKWTVKPDAEWSYTVTFDKNTTDEGSTAPNPATRTVSSPSQTVTSYPTTEPTRPGFVFRGYNTKADGTGEIFKAGPAGTPGLTIVAGDITVYAVWVPGYVIKFNKNASDSPDPSRPEIFIEVEYAGEEKTLAGEDIDLPTITGRPYYNFLGWNLLATFGDDDDPEETVFTEDTEITASVEVYAMWEFIGGTPEVVDGVLVHNRPLLEVKSDANGSTLNANGSITFTKAAGGAKFLYSFPDEVFDTDGTTLLYDYYRIDYTYTNTTSTWQNTQIHVYGGNDAQFVTGGRFASSNTYLPFSNQTYLVYETGYSEGGFQLTDYQNSGVDGTFTVTITSVKFYKAARYKVSFDYNYEGATTIADVEDLWAKNAAAGYPGYGVPAASWPATPDRSTEDTPMFLVGWFNGDAKVNPGEPQTESIALVARWTDTIPPGFVDTVTMANGGVGVAAYGFEIPNGVTLTDASGDLIYTGIKFKAKVSTQTSGRWRVWGMWSKDKWGDTTVENYWPQTNANSPNMNNGNMPQTGFNFASGDGGLFGDSGIGGSATFAPADGWKEYTFTFNTSGNYNVKPMFAAWDEQNTGEDTNIFILGMGLIGPGGGTSPTVPVSYKDIYLVGGTGVEPIEVLDPRSDKLWGEAGASAFIKVSGTAAVVTRNISFYEED
ncbi:InlB B-repeat-containing protein [Treponema sp. R80B11-R83G3]